MMRTLNNSLSCLAKEDSSNWDKYLPGVGAAYNWASHAATGISPFELNTGRVPLLPGEDSAYASKFPTPMGYSKKLRNVL